MSLINMGASLPSFMWPVVRLLLTCRGKLDEETARWMLTPPTLPHGETKDCSEAIKTLAELGLVTTAEGTVTLTAIARNLSMDDVAGFHGLLRRAVLDPARCVGLNEGDDLEGTKDLVRALVWFLNQDPTTPLDGVTAGRLQDGTFPRHLPPPFANDVRWGFFVFWGPALGFVAHPLADEGGSVKLLPDCTIAVRDTILSLWKAGESISASTAVERILTELPVLPGGAYSRSLGLAASDGLVSPVLSNALLTGDEIGWLSLDRQSDATDVVFLTDVDGTRVGVSNFIVNGSV
jgi:hypothetical protein